MLTLCLAAMLLVVPNSDERLTVADLKLGQAVYMVWPYEPRIVECVVEKAEPRGWKQGPYWLGWRADDGSRPWIEPTAKTEMYRTRRAAAAVVAAEYRRQAADLQKAADRLQEGK